MWRVSQLTSALTSGPHGSIVFLTACFSAASLSALFAAAIFDRFVIPAFVAAIGSLHALAVVSVVMLNRLCAKINDLHYAVSLERGLERAGYAVGDFFTDGAAATPSLQLLNLKVLRFCRPQRTLELGSGQTTKLLSCYAHENPSAYVLTLEQDEAWFRRLAPQIAHDYRFAPLERRAFSCEGTGLRIETTWYKDLPDLRLERFEYILVDGPDHGGPGSTFHRYARSGILQYFPSLLSTSFVVVFDDAERPGESMTVGALQDVLNVARIAHVKFAVHGIKTQVVVCSPDRSYLRSI